MGRLFSREVQRRRKSLWSRRWQFWISPERFISIECYGKQRSKFQKVLAASRNREEPSRQISVAAYKAPFSENAGRTSFRTGTLTNWLPRNVKRQGKSFARLMPIRGSATTTTLSLGRG